MFFTQELLEKRESGFGLLWLAATLGAKSSFKKLPRRSVLTADISQLCDLIAEPVEPLALRLSSNLMIGVARVYKVKQEMFLTDVTTCYNSLKKAVQELNTLSKGFAELQMGQPSMRPDALTLTADPGVAFVMDFGDMFKVRDKRAADEEVSDDEYDPSGKKSKQKNKAKQRPPSSLVEVPRANLHTLNENHEHLLSGSIDGSLSVAGFGAVGPSSSQMGGGFGFNDDLFVLPEGMDLGAEIGDELARELGEGWGGSPQRLQNSNKAGTDLFALDQHENALGLDFQFNEMQPAGIANVRISQEVYLSLDAFPPEGSIIVPLIPFSPDRNGDGVINGAPNKPTLRKAKRVRLLLDARTELTDEELKAARANYMEGQDHIRREIIQRKHEKESGRLIEEMIWGVPNGLRAPVLVDFWLESFRLQVEARAGVLHLESEGEPPRKRRKIGEETFQDEQYAGTGGPEAKKFGEQGMDIDMGFMFGGHDHQSFGNNWELDSRHRSSEEPGQARHASRPLSGFGSQFDLPGVGQDLFSGSQRSALFPWDNAGASSSVNGATLDFRRDSSAKRSFGRADTRLRGSSLSSRHESPLHSGRYYPDSPADFGLRNSQSGEGFQFDVPGDLSVLNESELSDANLPTLERNSFNFLEYAKMQLKTFPSSTSTLTFNDVVPKATSTPHVAAAAFYHCLVLATKDLVNVAQDEPYGQLHITVK
ncbi:uncharacterized protein LAESUDRAFT_661292 [Laetiporus sulphureus 93-53]|uniref:Rad21/Rec8-like protein N-terminal domain-containing protein n=1 Tax=Laetiporus sulphureus 93-53 TaxID=1314785 RepID=A0A165CEY4_9APHY|nr:uncharacterized protein LAESUDRAFT_661292 [Laetiporus sulphureus 93-53]KZT02692.1 hypothetical protein LAESUDRAFT_661292 [Laetiporus sulphureus 93-53]